MFGDTKRLKREICIAGMLAIVFAVGCQSPMRPQWRLSKVFDLKRAIPWKSREPEPGVPVCMVGTWTNAVRHQAGEKPERGFGGRILFYGPKNNDSIAVDGQLVVYAFDETNREPTDNRPTRRYVFPPEQFAKHRSENELGISYSVWLPWGESNGAQTKVSLIARFQPEAGPLIVSDQTSHLLPGTMLAEDEPNKPDDDYRALVAELKQQLRDARLAQEAATKQASYEAQLPSSAAPTAQAGPSTMNAQNAEISQQMRTTSISLPSTFRRQPEITSGMTSGLGGNAPSSGVSIPALPQTERPNQPVAGQW